MLFRSLLQDTFEVRAGRNVKAAIGEAFEALKRRERSLPDDIIRERERQWTEPRVRSLWENTRSEEHTSELQSLMRISYDVTSLKNNKHRLRERRGATIHTSLMHL